MIYWEKLNSIEQLSEIDEISKTQPVLIFKHSTRCSVSAASLNRLERKWDSEKAGSLVMYFLDLIAYREISNELVRKFGVKHESPQVLMIKEGECIYHNSHFGISFDELVEKSGSVSA